MPQLSPAEFAEVLRWLLWLWFAGLAMQPLAARIMGDQADLGYCAAKILGWLWVAFVPWMASALGVVSFAQGGPTVGVLGAGLLFLAFRRPGAFPGWRKIALIEAGFVALFVLGLAARLANADLTGLEKFMDLGFMAASMRAETMPPQDMWMSGHGINYYYFGHAAAGLWGLLANVSADHGYQLTMATLFALTGLGLYRLTHEITRTTGPRLATLSAATATALVLYAGNFHSVLYTVFRPWMQATKPDYYYPDSTRYIGFDPDTLDKAFTEFAAYGFRVGDMHAHVLAVPISVVAMLMLLSALRANWGSVRPQIWHSVVFGWLLGISYMTNAWDVAVIGLVALIVAAVLMLRGKGQVLGNLDRIGAALVVMLAVGFSTAAPFVADFVSFAEGLAWAQAHTPIWQLLVVYGQGLLPLGALLIAVAVWPNWRGPDQVFAAILAVSVLALIAIPEIIFVDDAYGEDYARANTMFKLSFRSQMLLQVAAMAAVAFFAARSRWQLALACAMAVPLIATFKYADNTFQAPGRIQTLDGLRYLGAERDAVAFIDTLHLAPGESILEAVGESFTDAGRIAAMTGQPAVLGWAGHERLWRSGDREVSRRSDMVRRVLGGARRGDVCQAVAFWGVRYVILGPVERQQFPKLDPAAFDWIGPTVFATPETKVTAVDPKACAP